MIAPSLPKTETTDSELSIFAQPLAVLIAKSLRPQSFSPPKLVLPGTETIQ